MYSEKSSVVIVVFAIAIAAVLLIPHNMLIPNIAKASSCSAQSSMKSSFFSSSQSGSGQGSCAVSAAANGKHGVQPASAGIPAGIVEQANGGGKNGACEARSADSSGVQRGFDFGQGSTVSCSSHSP